LDMDRLFFSIDLPSSFWRHSSSNIEVVLVEIRRSVRIFGDDMERPILVLKGWFAERKLVCRSICATNYRSVARWLSLLLRYCLAVIWDTGYPFIDPILPYPATVVPDMQALPIMPPSAQSAYASLSI